MAFLSGIDRVVYGVEDMELCTRYFKEWGLTKVTDTPDRKVFETLEKSQIELRRADDPTLPPAIEAGSTVREVVWGAESPELLDALLRALRPQVEVQQGEDGVWRCIDPMGLGLGFQVTLRRQTDIKGVATNTFDRANRVDQAAPVYPRAKPVRVAHVVFFCPDLVATQRFYTDLLQFNLTDEYPDTGLFLRCVEEGTHHNLFLLKTPDSKRGLNHVSFQVRDIYEVTGGGIHFARQGWDTQLGPGRHPISSALFWYFFCPAGALTEYYCDEDYFTRAWQPRQHERSPENFAEWAITGGIDGDSRRQKYLEESDLPVAPV